MDNLSDSNSIPIMTFFYFGIIESLTRVSKNHLGRNTFKRFYSVLEFPKIDNWPQQESNRLAWDRKKPNFEKTVA